MAAVKGQSRQILAGYPVLNALDAVSGVRIVSDYLVPTGGLAAGDIIEMCGLAEGLIVNDVTLICEDLDSNGSPTVTIDVGVLSGVYGDAVSSRTMGNEFIAASTVGQAGGAAHSTKAAGPMIAPSLDITPIGIKTAAAIATAVVGARIRLIVEASPAPVSV